MNISREEALRRLSSPTNLANTLAQPSSVPSPSEGSVEHREVTRSTPKRGDNVPEPVRDTIARAALSGVPQKTLAEKFGVAQQTVSSYKTNHIGGRPPSNERKAEHEDRVKQVRDSALDKLMCTLGLIDEAKLENLEAKDLGKFGKDMAAIYSSLSPKDGGIGGAPLNLVIYTPRLQDESRYKVVDVG